MNAANKKLIFDVLILCASITLAYFLIASYLLGGLIDVILPIRFLAEFIAGVLFTSFLTTPLSFATIYVLSEHVHPVQIALIGGLGAVIGDMIIIKIFRDNLFTDFHTLSKDLKLQKLVHFFKISHFNHLAPILGVLIIASPFPDEIGLMMLGSSRLKNTQLIVLTYILNSVGIYLITLTSQYIK